MQEVEDGEVSTYLVRDIAVGDVLEVRGPIGGYFVWAGRPRPLLLVGGGSGLAPLRAMWRAADPTAPVVVLASVTDARPACCMPPSSPTASAPARPSATVHVSRVRPCPPDAVRRGHPARGAHAPVRPGRRRHPSQAALAACGGAEADPAVFVCGPTSFVEALVDLLAGRRPRPALRAGRTLRLTRSRPTGATASDHRHHREAGRHDE